MINDNNVLLKKITEKKEEKKQKCHQMNLLGRFYCAARFSWASILSTLTKLDMQHKYYFLKELQNFFSFFFCFVSFGFVVPAILRDKMFDSNTKGQCKFFCIFRLVKFKKLRAHLLPMSIVSINLVSVRIYPLWVNKKWWKTFDT